MKTINSIFLTIIIKQTFFIKMKFLFIFVIILSLIIIQQLDAKKYDNSKFTGSLRKGKGFLGKFEKTKHGLEKGKKKADTHVKGGSLAEDEEERENNRGRINKDLERNENKGRINKEEKSKASYKGNMDLERNENKGRINKEEKNKVSYSNKGINKEEKNKDWHKVSYGESKGFEDGELMNGGGEDVKDEEFIEEAEDGEMMTDENKEFTEEADGILTEEADGVSGDEDLIEEADGVSGDGVSGDEDLIEEADGVSVDEGLTEEADDVSVDEGLIEEADGVSGDEGLTEETDEDIVFDEGN